MKALYIKIPTEWTDAFWLVHLRSFLHGNVYQILFVSKLVRIILTKEMLFQSMLLHCFENIYLNLFMVEFNWNNLDKRKCCFTSNCWLLNNRFSWILTRYCTCFQQTFNTYKIWLLHFRTLSGENTLHVRRFLQNDPKAHAKHANFTRIWLMSLIFIH